MSQELLYRTEGTGEAVYLNEAVSELEIGNILRFLWVKKTGEKTISLTAEKKFVLSGLRNEIGKRREFMVITIIIN